MSPPLQGKVPEELPGPTPSRTTPSVSSRAGKAILLALAALVVTFFARVAHKQLWHCFQSPPLDTAKGNLCPQAPELIPVKNNASWETLTDIYGTEAFQSKAVDWLSGAIRIPTESYDQMDPVGVDPRWEKFAVFHDYLVKAFPLVHSTFKLTKVNTYGLIFVWKGSDDTLKPLLLATHQDVVPVEPTTYDAWTYPPFSGHFDGFLIWGRGSVDDKSGLIGILSAMETMLANGFQPARTVVLASGFDEESDGTYGAQTLASELLEMFGENGYAMLVDEGAGFGDQYGQVIATPGIAEKGSIDVMIEVTTPGGHSSLPPPHTVSTRYSIAYCADHRLQSIGLLAEFLVTIEKNPFDVHLARGSPIYKVFQCLARHAPDLPSSLRKDIVGAERSDKALRSVAATQDHDAQLLKSLARAYNLSYTAFGVDMDGDMNTTARGTVTLSTAFGSGLEPAPITPTEGEAVPYRLLTGSIKAAYNSHRAISGDDHIIVSPAMMSGNTDADTKFYWKLTPHIFRYRHISVPVGGILPSGVHTVNEAILASSFVELIRFFTALILNVDESVL
ncbi:hypothetical protein J3R83DRAFT_8389 [Lanmaoa asiatica]|nr:hypothetical protein J3R83DRAFT_8389 [Lanmaoa asiatica]